MTEPAPSPVRRLADEAWDFQLEENPSWATFVGDPRFDDRLEERGPAARERRRRRLESLLRRVREIPAEGLDGEDAITRSVMERDLANQIESFDHHPWEWDFNQLTGTHVELQDILSYHPVDSEKGVRDLLARYEAVPGALEGLQGDLRDGIASGRVIPEVAYRRILSQLEAFAATPPAGATFGRTAASLPESVPAAARESLAADLQRAVREKVAPAYAGLLAFLKTEYEGKARETPGVHAIPGGKEAYAYAVRSHTTTDMTPEEIHALGLAELQRNRGEMLAIARRNGHGGDLRSYLDALGADPKHRLKTREALLERYRAILARMDVALPKAFGVLPRTPYRVEAMPAFKEKDAPAAYYYPPSDDGKRPGIFFANLHQPESWPTYEMETLSYHEAVPGHHFQIAVAQEQAGLPSLRRHSHYTAYIEGWAHYAERLSEEMEMFTADEDRVGMLAGQAWRAARLVVDTGMHFYGWPREKAVALLKEIKTGPDADVLNEIDRYIVWPGQALAYKVGHKRIDALRGKAERALGAAFDLRAFHDEILRHGALPLTVLDGVVDRWIGGRTGA